MQAPILFSGKSVVLDDLTREEIENQILRFCGQFGELVINQAFNLALAAKEKVEVNAYLTPTNVEITLRSNSSSLGGLKGKTGDFDWSIIRTLNQKGVLRLRQYWNGTVLQIKVRRVGLCQSETPLKNLAPVA